MSANLPLNTFRRNDRKVPAMAIRCSLPAPECTASFDERKSGRQAQLRRDSLKLVGNSRADCVRDGERVEQVGGIIKCFSGKARVEMIDRLEIHSPAAKGQIARADEHMGVTLAKEQGQLGVEYACGAGNRLKFIVDPCHVRLVRLRPPVCLPGRRE